MDLSTILDDMELVYKRSFCLACTSIKKAEDKEVARYPATYKKQFAEEFSAILKEEMENIRSMMKDVAEAEFMDDVYGKFVDYRNDMKEHNNDY